MPDPISSPDSLGLSNQPHLATNLHSVNTGGSAALQVFTRNGITRDDAPQLPRGCAEMVANDLAQYRPVIGGPPQITRGDAGVGRKHRPASSQIGGFRTG